MVVGEDGDGTQEEEQQQFQERQNVRTSERQRSKIECAALIWLTIKSRIEMWYLPNTMGQIIVHQYVKLVKLVVRFWRET